MNCIEVGELMHRKIDSDLTEEETFRFEMHLANCEACNQMFTRLHLLSTQLEQLPRVAPSFSIVDSILPKLAEIDKQNEHEQKIIHEEAVSLEPVLDTKRNQTRKKWLTVATSGLVAAAAILLTVNLVDRDKDSLFLAESSIPMVASDQNYDLDSSFSKMLFNETSSNTENNNQISVVDQMGTSINPTSSNTVDQFSIETVKPDAVESFMVSGESTEEQQPELDDMIHEEEVGIFSSEQLGARIATDFTVANVISPDERFYLGFNEHIITIHDMNTNESIKAIDVPIKGTINFIGWHEQSIEFYVDVVDDQLQTHRLTFTLGE